jgi:hypothetical protein
MFATFYFEEFIECCHCPAHMHMEVFETHISELTQLQIQMCLHAHHYTLEAAAIYFYYEVDC